MKYTLEIPINQPREKVVQLFDRVENLAFGQPGFIKAESLEGEPGAVGSKTKLVYENRGRPVELVETVTVNNLPDEYSGIFETSGMTMEVKNFFKEDGPDRTIYITENAATVRGFFMKLVTILMPGCFKSQSLKYMQNFKAFAETGADCRQSA